MRTIESDIQINCVNWFRLQYPEPNYLIYAIPNGGNRNVKTATWLKKEGVRAGMPDLVIHAKNKMFYVEMKAPLGVLQLSQKETHKILKNLCVNVYVCRSFDEFKEIVNDEIRPIKSY